MAYVIMNQTIKRLQESQKQMQDNLEVLRDLIAHLGNNAQDLDLIETNLKDVVGALQEPVADLSNNQKHAFYSYQLVTNTIAHDAILYLWQRANYKLRSQFSSIRRAGDFINQVLSDNTPLYFHEVSSLDTIGSKPNIAVRYKNKSTKQIDRIDIHFMSNHTIKDLVRALYKQLYTVINAPR